MVHIRTSHSKDLAGIERVYADAFPDEDLLPVVRELLDFGPGVLSLVAVKENIIVGHVIFCDCRVGEQKVSMLAPLCAAPALHKQGIGTALVQGGFDRLKSAGVAWVYVLGSPNYYGRFGFEADGDVAPPYPLPKAYQELGAWQSVVLSDAPKPKGKLDVPAPWQQAKYWSEG
ncbi:N-acetyltransferase [Magnetovibrio sp. PR-2]|uniref:GNAT family N-acetyltransferase n=1 Tax=Magnetovibrio sp. PR-2 TaxID=3120356 RepID=UPI002FCE4D23